MKRLFAFILASYILITGTITYGREAGTNNSLTSLFNELNAVNGSSQIIVVSNEKESQFNATVQAYEKTSAGWINSLPSMGAVIGKNGFSLMKREGDLKAPAGIFRIGTAFGMPGTPGITKLPYISTTTRDYWIDDASSLDYNKWIKYNGDPYTKWKSFEKLRITRYKYAFVIEYNMNPIVKGNGSAIFFHIWKGSNISTSGCTAVSEANILKLLGWLKPDKNPIIIQGTQTMISNMLKSAGDKALYPIKAIVNNNEVPLDVPPRIVNGRVLIPVRSIFENLGAKVAWEQSTGTITISKDSTIIKLTVGSNMAFAGTNQVPLDVPATIVSGRTIVPLRFIAENLGLSVSWNQIKRIVSVDGII
ncbi:stalk domain-containing protein [Pseudobacteroides cellulosolvens]|uniref:Copper amine oxidase-like domain-containing protein n=1 Tax=Pseudobacteroides cellulosolvens ATCC 35603 = DSM 2933 TaxID=398512 RepID=A0A0L6JW02_9FIRM|nr:stalk domain-containing protein [Pseudobacteroides cellulosolvens]KNY29612.1 copper amine oxidase-like domain-containing protein [Pseudobacteroides cellulosolvens ATCC 35603 = DSM 2933]